MPIRTRVRPWMLVSAAWLGPAVFGAINEAAQRRLYGGPRASVAELLFASGDWLLYAFLTPLVFAIARRWPLARPRLGRRVLLHLAFALLFCVLWAGAGTVLRASLMPGALRGDGGPTVHFVSWLFVTLPFGIAVYFCVVGIEHAVRYFVEARERETQMARLAERLAGAQLAALEARLNPHFLFNTLNTIAVFVRDGDRTGAARMIEQLSEVLRRSLSPRRANEVALATELDLVRQYLAIEQARFPDRLRVAWAIGDGLERAAVPGFAVQHLVENAVRHGIARRPEAGLVRIAASRVGDALVVAVSDDGPGIDPSAPPAPGHGLANTAERLRVLYGDRGSLVVAPAAGSADGLADAPGAVGAADRGTVATLSVPWREIPGSATDGAR